jgi:hypothetical protein
VSTKPDAGVSEQERIRIMDEVAAGTATYEHAADLFMGSMAGRMSGVSREEFLTRLRAKFPTQELLSAYLSASLATFNAAISGGPIQ